MQSSGGNLHQFKKERSMKTIIFYDTETTGLPLWSEPSEHPAQPYITQIAAELCIEETGDTIGSINLLVRPEGWVIPEELEILTGITTAHALAHGLPADFVIGAFLELWKGADMRCGHNESFDMRMVRIQIMRHAHYAGFAIGDVSFADYWKTAPAYCTQGNSVKICNLPPTDKMLAARRKGPKSPNLGEAYKHFTGEELVGAHNAMVDVQAAKCVYYGIKKHLAANA
jgi:DNA polymerase-3 subunit epsilon